METANTTIDYKKLGASFEMQVNTIKIRNKRKSKGKYGSKHRLPFTPKKVLKNDVPKIKEHLHVSLWSDMEIIAHIFFLLIEVLLLKKVTKSCILDQF